MISTNIFITIMIVYFAKPSFQYSTGAPSEACLTMLPQHGPAQAQVTIAPYNILISSRIVQQGSNIRVTISILSRSHLRGFFLQARNTQNRDQIIGHWSNLPVGAKTVNCIESANTVTHTSNLNKDRLVFQWNSPKDFTGSVVFIATIAESFEVFWKGIESNILVVNPPKLPKTPTIIKTTTEPTFTVFCSMLTIENNKLICKLRDGPLDVITERK